MLLVPLAKSPALIVMLPVTLPLLAMDSGLAPVRCPGLIPGSIASR